MIRFLYNLLFPLGLLVFLPKYLLKIWRRGNYGPNFAQRFAIYSGELQSRLARQHSTWIHAVSVGEVAVALKLVRELRKRDAAFRCVLTTTTPTGFAVAEQNASESLLVLYNPLDWWPIVRRAFAVIRPLRIILVEAEVWPNLAAEARRRRVPLALVNARLSVRSERRFRRFRGVVAPTFRCLDLVCAQDAADLVRWEKLGVPAERIAHVGSIKYDPAEAAAPTAFDVRATLRIDETRPVVLAGSTHAGEEEIVADVFKAARAEFPELLLLIAPRHVERAPQVHAVLERKGLRVALRSQLPLRNGQAADCILIDTTGELRAFYAAATVVFMGKSLTVHGGQNPVEPILAGKPVVFGPHMENFSALADALCARGGAVQVSDPASFTEAVLRLLRNAAERDGLVRNAHAVLAEHQGATARTAALVLSLKSHTAAAR